MSKIIKYNEPKLITLENKVRLYDYKESDLNKACVLLVADLADLLGVSDQKTRHLNKLTQFIKGAYTTYTLEEIQYAFQLYVEGEFIDKPYQQLNAVVFGKVMRDFQNYKSNKLQEYRRKKRFVQEQEGKPSSEQIERMMLDAVDRCAKEVKYTGKLEGSEYHIYDFLEESGRHKFSEEEKKREFIKAKEIIRKEMEIESLESLDARKKFKKILKSLDKNGRVIGLAKTLLLEKYLIKKQMGL